MERGWDPWRVGHSSLLPQSPPEVLSGEGFVSGCRGRAALQGKNQGHTRVVHGSACVSGVDTHCGHTMRMHSGSQPLITVTKHPEDRGKIDSGSRLLSGQSVVSRLHCVKVGALGGGRTAESCSPDGSQREEHRRGAGSQGQRLGSRSQGPFPPAPPCFSRGVVKC